MADIVGTFSQTVIDILELDNITAESPIFIGESNIEHIKSRHPYEYDKYYIYLSEILSSPDYVGINPKDNSIGFVKVFKICSEYVRVAVRISTKGKSFVKSLHTLSTYNAENYIERGTLKRLS